METSLASPAMLPFKVPFLFSVWSLAVVVSCDCYGQSSPSETTLSFNRDVRPILSDNCFQCHGPDASTRATDLRLDLKENALADRGGYFTVVPGKPEQSELIERILEEDSDLKMPPDESGKALTSEQIQILRQWVKQGAAWPAYWAYEPLQKNDQRRSATTWGRGWIDELVWRGLAARQLKPSPPADPVTLVRRLHLDLTGLPPSPEVVRGFVSGETGYDYESLVDGLLDSPQFGERMAMYWLDLVRYADTVGYHGDQDHNISPYRSWVIDAFNRNLPFDEFTRSQLAGDLIPEATREQKIASGYNRLLQTTHEGGLQIKEYRAIYAADRVRNVSAVWMGATLGCAQCHDHKYDPYTAKDFYAMAAFFSDIDDEQHFKIGTNALPTRRPPEILIIDDDNQQQLDELAVRIAALNKERQDLEKIKKSQPIDDEVNERKLGSLQQQIKQLRATRSEIEGRGAWTMITKSLAEPRVTRVLPRGNWLDESGAVVEPAVPEFLPAISAERRASRLDLADWLTDSHSLSGQLTARVMANRIWYLLMGSGVCQSLDDFGSQSEPPRNQPLLDRLAIEFTDSGWDIKQLVRSIVMSDTYRQTSQVSAESLERDPYNQLFGRQDRFRLPAEQLRDSLLFVSGLLNLEEVGGKSVKPYQPEGYYQHLNFPPRKYKPDQDRNQWRRGIYVHWQRQFLHPTMRSLDAPSREECTASRPRSNTPLAALALLNDPSFLAAAVKFAQRMMAHSPDSVREGIRMGFETATSRVPDAEELAILETLYSVSLQEYESQPEAANQLIKESLLNVPVTDTLSSTKLAAWICVARALLNLDETITRN